MGRVAVRCVATLLLGAALASFVQLVKATAPPHRYTAASGTVRDNRTKLLWQHPASAATFTQHTGADHCAMLQLGPYGSGWRLPGRSELLSIIDPTERDPAMDRTAFAGAPAATFWSASPNIGGTDSVYVDFRTGATFYTSSTNVYLVRCVHDDP